MQITYRGTAPQKFTICDGRDAQYMDLDFTVWRPFSPVSTVGVTWDCQFKFVIVRFIRVVYTLRHRAAPSTPIPSMTSL